MSTTIDPADAPVGSHYLSGNYAPVLEEQTTFDLTVRGNLPAELNGRYLRNGPNPAGTVDPANYHWFTGTGMLHGVRLRDGKAEWYRNRFVRSTDVCTERGWPLPTGPAPLFDINANTSIVSLGQRLCAVVESGGPIMEVNSELETIGRTDLDGTLGDGGFSAHPHFDPHTGEYLVMAYFFAWDHVRYVVLDSAGRVKKSVQVPVPDGPMIHDMAFTETKALVFDFPCVFSLDAAMTGKFPYLWNPDRAARIGLLDRNADNADDIVWVEVDPCYVFHPLNAFDTDDGKVVFDAPRHPRMFAEVTNGPNDGPPSMARFTLDPASGRGAYDVIDEAPHEFPRPNETLSGRRHRYGWAVGLDGTEMAGRVVKHDIDARTSISHDLGPGRGAGEFVFVPRESNRGEDDGWLLGFDMAFDGSDAALCVLDGQTMESVARVEIPHRVPFGFHGNWFAD